MEKSYHYSYRTKVIIKNISKFSGISQMSNATKVFTRVIPNRICDKYLPSYTYFRLDLKEAIKFHGINAFHLKHGITIPSENHFYNHNIYKLKKLLTQ